MSLINDALKQAQHQRSGGNSMDLPPMPGSSSGHKAEKRGTIPPEKKLTILVACGLGGLILAVLVVSHLLSDDAPPAPVIAAKPAPVKTAAATVSIAPVVSAAPPATAAIQLGSAPPNPAPVAVQPKSGPSVFVSPLTTVAASVAPDPIISVAPAADEPPRLANGQDIRVLTFIDALRVAGIRSSGGDSKVLMNERVYRINDMVDYTLGIKLTRVASDSLTFTDPGGTVYVKNF